MATKSSAAKKTGSTPGDAVDVWFLHTQGKDPCPSCGHLGSAHTVVGSAIICPPTPPAKQVTVDEAVVSKGGKSGFVQQLEDATGATSEAERKKLAAENFDRRAVNQARENIPLKHLRPMKNNPRGDELGDVSALVSSIEANGFIGALNVRPILEDGSDEVKHYEVWAGNRRLAAAKQAGLEEVPCDIYELTEGQALELNGAEQINRSDLTPLQEGELCRKLMELQGYDEHQVAAKLGQSKSWVTKRVALCGIAPELRKDLGKGELSVTLANALAALPSQQLQIKAAAALAARPDWELRRATAESDAEWIRNTYCRPLSDATWKLTDAELLPEAGACSVCPHNSSNAKMPGLFDNAKAKPTCAKTECFEQKEIDAWLKRTAKAKAEGAKVLSLNECRKLFARGNDLGSASRYVEAGDKAPKDKQGRSWGELAEDVAAEHRPQLHLAQDNAGKLRSLYVGDKLLEVCATHLKLRWAKTVVEGAEEAKASSSPEARAKKDAEAAEAVLVRRVREEVAESVLERVAAKYAADFGTGLPQLRFIAGKLGERALERFTRATGKKKLPKDWLAKGATVAELVALVWLNDAADELGNCWDGFDERLLALAKTHGIDVEAAVKAQLATARAEAGK